jgi:hypothetical protein
MRKLTRNAILASLLATLPAGALAETATYGWIEKAAVGAQETIVKAKLDSGALTSSLHATEVERFTKDGEEWVRFTLDLEDEESGKKTTERLEKPLHRDLTVRGAGGKEQRPVVLFDICLGNTIYEEQVSLNDRSDMLYPLLLGRRTIQHLGKLDVTRTFLHEPSCGADAPFVAQDEDERSADDDIGA